MLVCSRRKSCGQCVNLTYYLTREARPGPLQLLIVHVTVRSERLVGARRNPHASPGPPEWFCGSSSYNTHCQLSSPLFRAEYDPEVIS